MGGPAEVAAKTLPHVMQYLAVASLMVPHLGQVICGTGLDIARGLLVSIGAG
jgi:hypothetical protein